MSNENKQPAGVRVCAISDAECSRGCGAGACKKENKQNDERTAFVAVLEAFMVTYRCKGWEGDWTYQEAERLLARATQQATKGDERAATGFLEADHIINRLMSSDPQFDDCADAAELIRKLVRERQDSVSDAHRLVRAAWRSGHQCSTKMDSRALWCAAESYAQNAIKELVNGALASQNDAPLRALFIEAMDFAIGFGPRLSQVGEWKEARDTKADGFVARATTPSTVAGSAGQAASKCKRPGKCWIAERGIKCPRCDTAPSLATDAGAVLKTINSQEALAAIDDFEIVGDNNDSRDPTDEDRFILTEFIAHCFDGYRIADAKRDAEEVAAQRATINQAADVIAIFTGHDSYRNLKNKFGDDPWTSINKIEADLRALCPPHPSEQRES